METMAENSEDKNKNIEENYKKLAQELNKEENEDNNLEGLINNINENNETLKEKSKIIREQIKRLIDGRSIYGALNIRNIEAIIKAVQNRIKKVTTIEELKNIDFTKDNAKDDNNESYSNTFYSYIPYSNIRAKNLLNSINLYSEGNVEKVSEVLQEAGIQYRYFSIQDEIDALKENDETTEIVEALDKFNKEIE